MKEKGPDANRLARFRSKAVFPWKGSFLIRTNSLYPYGRSDLTAPARGLSRFRKTMDTVVPSFSGKNFRTMVRLQKTLVMNGEKAWNKANSA